MIEQALKVIAQFKDEATEGIKRLQSQLNEIGKSKANLGNLDDPRTAANIDRTAQSVKKVNDEAKQAVTGGISQLSTAFGQIKADFGGLIDGSTNLGDALSAAVGAGATQAAAALTAAGAAGGAATGALAAAAAQTNKSADAIKNALDIFKSARGGSRDEINAANRAIYEIGRSMGMTSKEAAAFRKQISDVANAADKAGSPLKALSAIFSSGFFKSTQTAGAVRAEAFAQLGVAATATASILGATALAVAGSVGALSLALNSAADDAAELAEKLGISVDRLKTLQLIADETGTSVQGLQSVYDKLTKVLDKTDESTDKAATALANLGLSFEEIKSQDPRDAAAEIIARYEALGKTAEATAAVQLLLGNSFRESSLGIKAAATDFDSYANRIKQYGAGESRILIEQGAQQEVAINNLALAFAGFGQQLVENVGPAISIIIQSFADTVNAIRKTEIAGKLVQLVFGTIKLLIVDLGRFIGGLSAALVALFSGEFKQAAAIAKSAFGDAADAVKNFGAKTEESAESAKKLSEAEVKAAAEAAKRAAAQKKAAEEQAKLFKDAETELFRQLQLIGAVTEAERLQFEIEKGRFKNLTNNQKALLIDLAQMIDLKKQELDVDQRKKQIEENIAGEQTAISLAEEELRFAFLTADEREKQVFLLRELNKLRVEGKGLDEVTLSNMRDQITVLAERRAALRKALDEQSTQQSIIAESEAAITASVQRNIQLAAELLTTRKINEADYVRYVETQVKRITDLNKQAAEETSEFWRAAAQGIQGAFQSFFYDFMQGNLTDLVGGVKRAIDQVIANLLAAKVAAALFGAELSKTGQVGGFVGAAGQFLGGLFGGARAEGGPIEAGKPYLVGERGPELRTFGAPGNIVSNDKLMSLGSNVSISFRVDAIDASSFRSKIDEFKRDIASAVSDAQVSYGV